MGQRGPSTQGLKMDASFAPWLAQAKLTGASGREREGRKVCPPLHGRTLNFKKIALLPNVGIEWKGGR